MGHGAREAILGVHHHPVTQRGAQSLAVVPDLHETGQNCPGFEGFHEFFGGFP